MRVLLQTLYFAPDIGANAAIITELAQELAALGHEVTVVTAFPHYAGNVIAPAYRGRVFQREEWNGIRIIRTYLYTSPNKERVTSRVMNYLSFNVLSGLAGVFSGPQDIILAPSPPLTNGMTAWITSSLKRTQYIYNVQDIYPDIAIRLGMLTRPALIRFFQWMERFVYSKSVAVSVLSDGFRCNLAAKGVPLEKLHVIPNFVDVDFIRPLPKDNYFSRKYGLQDRFVIMYAGNIGLSQGLTTLLQTAHLLRDLSDLLVLIVGNGAARQTLEAEANAMALNNVKFLPFQPREDLPNMYASADLSLVMLRRGVGAESVPSKAYPILASARPLVAAVDEEAETRQLIAKAQCGVAVPPEEPLALAGPIRELYGDAELRKSMGDNGRAYAMAHYTPQSVAKQYDELLKKVVNAR